MTRDRPVLATQDADSSGEPGQQSVSAEAVQSSVSALGSTTADAGSSQISMNEILSEENTEALLHAVEHTFTDLESARSTCCDFQRRTKTSYLLWLFLGFFGVHHLYLRRYSHFLWCALYLWMFGQMGYAPKVVIVAFVFYFVLWIVDGVRLEWMIKVANMPYELRQHQWSLFDIYLFWLPPYGLFGMHQLYLRNRWVGISYFWSFGLLGFGWLSDLFLIRRSYWPEIVSSLQNVGLDKTPSWATDSNQKRSFGTILMTWCPLGGWIGLPYFYAGDVVLGICKFLTLNVFFIGWILDLFRLKSLVNTYNDRIDAQIEYYHLFRSKRMLAIATQMSSRAMAGINAASGKNSRNEPLMADIVDVTHVSDVSDASPKATKLGSDGENEAPTADIGGNDANGANEAKGPNTPHAGSAEHVHSECDPIRLERPLIFKKTVFDAYVLWLGSFLVPGVHHLYLHNWVLFLGHIVTLGGFGLMWVLDLFLMPWFVKRTNEKLALSTRHVRRSEASDASDASEAEECLDEIVSEIDPNGSQKRLGSMLSKMSLDAQIGSDAESGEEAATPRGTPLTPGKTDDGESYKPQDDNRDFNEKQKEGAIEFAEFAKMLYMCYLFWTPLTGIIGVYYLCLGKYKTFCVRLLTLNFLLLGWFVDLFRMYWLVKEYVVDNKPKK